MKLISFILPAYNEKEVLEHFYATLANALNALREKYNFELLFINDGSTDDSLDILLNLQKKDQRIRVISFSRNFGHQAAITAGLDFAEGDAAIIMDTDLQDPPATALELIKKWEQGFDVVYAQRQHRRDGLMKSAAAAIFYRVINHLADFPLPNNTGDFRLMNKKAVLALRQFKEGHRYMRGLSSYVGFKQAAVQFDRDARYAGTTKYPWKKMFKFSADAITSFSTVPLELITKAGFLVSLLSFLGIIYALIMRFCFPAITVSGWTLMIISIFFIGGVQMIILGVLGMYIGRIYLEVKHRPLYIVAELYQKERQ